MLRAVRRLPARLLVVVGALALTLGGLLASPAQAATPPTGARAVSSTTSTTAMNGATAAPSPRTFVPLTPTRLLDTRLGHPGPATPAHPVLSVPVLGRGGVPTGGVALVTLTLTVVTPTASGYVGHGQESSVNFAAGQTVANLAVLPVGADGTVSLTVRSSGTTQLLADVAGYVRSGTALTSGALVTGGSLPGRLFDSRTAAQGYIRPNTSMAVYVGPDLPSGTTALLANLTVVAPATSGYVTASPEVGPGLPSPSTSTVNFTAGRTTANYLVFPVLDGYLQVFNHTSAPLAIVLDGDAAVVPGTPNADGAVQGLYPARVLDTRTGLGAPGPVRGGGTARFTVRGRGAVPSSGVGAVALNVTVTGPTAGGYVTAHPGGSPSPPTSVLNFSPGQTVADAVIVPIGPDGTVSLTVQLPGTAQLVADVEGYVTSAAPAPAVSVVANGVIDPTTGGLHGVSCADRTFCVALGTAPGLRTFDGTTWSAPLRPTGLTHPRSVSCASAVFCAVVQGDDTVLRWDGRSWTASPVSAATGDSRSVGLEAVSCPTATFCMAVDWFGRTTTWDGARWSPTAAVPSARRLSAVSCSSPTSCVAVGSTAGSAVSFDGTTWTPTPAFPVLGADPAPGSLSCVSSTSCLAVVVDTAGSLESLVYDGRSWQAPQALGPTNVLFAWPTVSCVSSTSCTMVAPLSDSVRTFDGSAWSAPVALGPGVGAGGTPAVADGLSCVDPQWCVVTDSTGQVFVGATSEWSPPDQVAPLSGRLVTAGCASATFCVADDSYGNVLTFDGSTWGPPRQLVPGHALDAVTCPTTTSCLVGTDDGRLVTVTPTGTTGSTVVDPGHLITAVSCWAATGCAAGDDAGRVVTGSTAGWGPPVQVVGQNQSVGRLSCGSATLCGVLGDQQLYTGHGTSWTQRLLGAYPATYWELACSAVACLADGGAGELYQFGPTPSSGWTSTWVDWGKDQGRFGCTLSGQCLLITADGLTDRIAGGRIGGSWGPPVPVTDSADDVSCVDPGVCVGSWNDSATVFRIG